MVPTLHWSRPGSETEIPMGTVHQTNTGEDLQMRHRHFFEQIRYIKSGSMTYGPGKKAEAGDCVYFPESVPYGPVTYEPGSEFLLQWSGPSEHGIFIIIERFGEGAQRLIEAGGQFDKSNGGVYTHPDGRKQEGYEAVAEFVEGRQLTYAPARYDGQVLMRGSTFPAIDIEGAPGARIKHLGYYNEVGPNIKIVQLDAGAVLPAAVSRSQQVWDVISGEISYEGGSYPQESLLYAAPGADRRELRAEQPTELLVLHLRHPNGPPMPFSEF